MLRLPPFRYHRPRTIAEAVSIRADSGDGGQYVAGGTDLIPNMKHGLFEPADLVSLRGVAELKGIERRNGALRLGAGETLADVAAHPLVREHAPALASAAGQVAGPQLRNVGTLGGNLCLDTRCTYYNQTRFWRQALGFCLKKDGTVCHVTKVGKKCVAAHSADTPPVFMCLDATVELIGPDGSRELPVSDLFVSDGIWNSRREPAEILAAVSVPVRSDRRQGYAKLRQRKSIDFPLLTVAVSADLDGDRVKSVQGVVTALGARPRVLSGWELAAGRTLDAELIEALAERAHEQCRPLENMIVDADWRRAMVPVYVRRALGQLGA